MYNQHQNGFTLIEVMIVIAIIGILAAIATPNFIAYRDKAYCKTAESDANNIASVIAGYYSIPSNLTFVGGAVPGAPEAGAISLSGLNTATISGTLTTAIVITVTEGTGRCPNAYMVNLPNWTAATSVFTKRIQ